MIDLFLLFNTAYAFEQAAFRVPAIERLQDDENAPVYTWDISVATTNSALALELYLKALWVIERTSDPPKTHRLDILFDGLSSETKESLARAYASFSSMQWTVAQMLAKAAYQFEESRYPYEYTGDNLHKSRAWSYELAVPYLFRKRILELRPDLALPGTSA
jgi:hypothetical protein